MIQAARLYLYQDFIVLDGGQGQIHQLEDLGPTRLLKHHGTHERHSSVVC